MTGSVEFRPFRREDAAGVSSLRKLFSLAGARRSCEPAYFEWKYGGNPHATPKAWVAKRRGEIVGVLGMVPKRLKVGDAEFVVAEFVDAFTHPSYQGQGICGCLAREVLGEADRDGIPLIYQTPNELAFRYWTAKFDFWQPFWLRRTLIPVAVGGLPERWLRLPALAQVATRALDSSLAALAGWRDDDGSRLRDHVVSSFPADVDALWQRARTQCEILLVRDRSYLQWRYVQNPDRYELVVFEEDGATVGIAVLKTGQVRGLQFGYLCDLLSDGRPEVTRVMLERAIARLRQRRVHVVEIWSAADGHYGHLVRRLRGVRFSRRQHYLIRGALAADTAGALRDPRALVFAMGDTDNI